MGACVCLAFVLVSYGGDRFVYTVYPRFAATVFLAAHRMDVPRPFLCE